MSWYNFLYNFCSFQFFCTFVPENKTCQFGKAACIFDVSTSENYHQCYAQSASLKS